MLWLLWLLLLLLREEYLKSLLLLVRNGLTFSCGGHGCCFGNVRIDIVCGHVIHRFSVSVGGKGIGLMVAEHFFRVSLCCFGFV